MEPLTLPLPASTNEPAPRRAPHEARQLESEQPWQEYRDGEPGTIGEQIEIAIPFRAEQREQPIVFRDGTCALSYHRGRHPELVEHVGGSLDQAGAVPQEGVTTSMTAAQNAAGHRHDVAPLL
jgi:hypothetical protein